VFTHIEKCVGWRYLELWLEIQKHESTIFTLLFTLPTQALYALRQYPLPLKDGKEAKQLPNVGEK